MRVSLAQLSLASLDEVHSESLCVYLFEDAHPLKGLAGLVDWRMGARISGMILSGWLAGSAGERLLMPVKHKLPVNKIFVFGLGPLGRFTPDMLRGVLRDSLEVLCAAGVHATILAAPGRGEGVASDLEAVEAVCGALDPPLDLDEVVVMDEYRRMQDAWRVLDLRRGGKA